MKFVFFTSDVDSSIGKPIKIKNVLPQWYKDAETFYVEKINGKEEKHAGLKKCVPFLDSLISGYAIVTPFDIYIGKKEDGSIDIKWNSPEDLSGFIGERTGDIGLTIPRPAGHLPNHLVWSNKWGWKAPKGYSILVTHPLNRFDLPFTTTSGIIDSDKFITSGNIPFFLKEGFYGLIPAGTPVAQLIPIKRKRWEMVVTTANKSISSIQGRMARDEKRNYKRKFWVKKEYN